MRLITTIIIATVPFAIILAVLMIAGYMAAKTVANPKQNSLPNLAGETNWGLVSQTGRTLTITGHPHWSATGTIRQDKTVLLFWTEIETMDVAIGVYTVSRYGLEGEWGYGYEVKLGADGKLSGETEIDSIRKIKD